MRIVHAADIHLDSPLQGLKRLGDADVAHRLRTATRRALENLVTLVVDEEADALVLAGDVYDGDWRDYATGRFFAEQMGRLHDHGITVYMIAGNHDAESQITRSLVLPPNVRNLSTQEPETVVDESLGLAVHGQGFAQRAVLDNLALRYPDRRRGFVNVGLLHTSVQGAVGHDPYAPCTPEDLARLEYEYTALGHVHEHRIVNDGPHIAAFSGNLQGRHPRETGAKGALVVDLEPEQRAVLRAVPLDVARWAVAHVDVSGTSDLEDVVERTDRRLAEVKATADGRLTVVRVELAGETAVAGRLTDSEMLHEQMSLLGTRHGMVVERVRSRATTSAARDSVDPELSAAIDRAAADLVGNPQALKELVADLDREIGRETRAAGLVDLRDEATLTALAEQALRELTSRMGSEA